VASVGANGRLAAALMAGSMVTFAALLVVPSSAAALKQVGTAVMPILWVLGVLVLASVDRPAGRGLARIAVLLYGFAFLLPAATARSDGAVIWGFQAFALGLTIVPAAWAANVGFVAALELARRGVPGRGAIAAAVSVLLALTAPLTLPADFPVSAGFLAWTTAPGILFLALANQPRGIPAGRSDSA
jgi:hypothetical protein